MKKDSKILMMLMVVLLVALAVWGQIAPEQTVERTPLWVFFAAIAGALIDRRANHRL